jgi:two-component system, NtrC family, sensor kinase
LEDESDLAWVQENLPRLLKSSLDGLSRVRDIVKNLRNFARLDEAELDGLDLNAALECTVEVLRHEIDAKQISIEINFDPIPQVVCRPGQIHQLFHNLLLNAVQASQLEGTIDLRTAEDEDFAIVEVRDYGCGIDAANQSRIFEPFFTTKPVGKGSGLGLATCYGIVTDHGGSIDVDSQVGQGSTFRVRIPFDPPRTRETTSS